MGFLLSLLLSAALMVISYLLMPKIKQEQQETREMENPTAEAGIPQAVLFGTKTIKGPNCLWFGDKSYRKSKVKA